MWPCLICSLRVSCFTWFIALTGMSTMYLLRIVSYYIRMQITVCVRYCRIIWILLFTRLKYCFVCKLSIYWINHVRKHAESLTLWQHKSVHISAICLVFLLFSSNMFWHCHHSRGAYMKVSLKHTPTHNLQHICFDVNCALLVKIITCIKI